MDVDFDRSLTLPSSFSGFGDGQAHQARVCNGFALAVWQIGQHGGQVFVCVAGAFFAVNGQGVRPVIDVVVQTFAPAVGTQMVDPLVTRNGIHPSAQRLIALVGVAFLMDGHQGFLHKVLDIAGLRWHPFLQKAPHMAAHQDKGSLVAGVIALQGLHPCSVQRGFEVLQAFAQVNSSVKVKKLQAQIKTNSVLFK